MNDVRLIPISKMQQLGEFLREKRLASSMTIEAMARDLEISAESMSKIENGESEMSFETLCRFSNLLNVPPSEILDLIALSPDRLSKI